MSPLHTPLSGRRDRWPIRLGACMGPVAVVLVTALAAGCASTPAEDDPVQVKLNDLDARVARIERIISNQSLVELAQHLDAVQGDVRQLRGRIEELEYNTQTLSKQQNDLDKRIAAPGGGGSSPAAAGTASGPGPTEGAAGGAGPATGSAATAAPTAPASDGSSVEQTVYAQAFDSLKAGSYSVAITGFKDFLSSYPASPLAENAQYWLGEAYYVTRDFDAASNAFRNVLQKWPDSRKAPDALLKLGYTQLEQKKTTDGRATLTQVIQKYPGTDAARLATDRLQHAPAK
jgi:tol-pal system protein YbgF